MEHKHLDNHFMSNYYGGIGGKSTATSISGGENYTKSNNNIMQYETL